MPLWAVINRIAASKLNKEMSNEEAGMLKPPIEPLFKGTAWNSVQAQLVQRMFAQASLQISYLLEQLTKLYKLYGVKYDVTGCYDSLMRMLTPFQLLTHFSIKTPIGLLNQNYANQFILPKVHTNLEASEPPGKWTKNASQQKQNPADSPGKRARPKNWTRVRNGGRPILEKEQEAYVQQFIRGEIEKGVTLTMPHIAEFAKRISKNERFVGSPGWVKNFMKRHPQMRSLYQYSRLSRKTAQLQNSRESLQNQQGPIIGKDYDFGGEEENKNQEESFWRNEEILHILQENQATHSIYEEPSQQSDSQSRGGNRGSIGDFQFNQGEQEQPQRSIKKSWTGRRGKSRPISDRQK